MTDRDGNDTLGQVAIDATVLIGLRADNDRLKVANADLTARLQRAVGVCKALAREIEIGTFFDKHGHDAKMLKAYHEARAVVSENETEAEPTLEEYHEALHAVGAPHICPAEPAPGNPLGGPTAPHTGYPAKPKDAGGESIGKGTTELLDLKLLSQQSPLILANAIALIERQADTIGRLQSQPHPDAGEGHRKA